jgi:hypothetical protein
MNNKKKTLLYVLTALSAQQAIVAVYTVHTVRNPSMYQLIYDFISAFLYMLIVGLNTKFEQLYFLTLNNAKG